MGNTRKDSNESRGLKMTISLLSARINTLKTWQRQLGSCEVYDERIDELHAAKDALLKDFVLAVANGILTGKDSQLGASMLCEAFEIRSSTH